MWTILQQTIHIQLGRRVVTGLLAASLGLVVTLLIGQMFLHHKARQVSQPLSHLSAPSAQREQWNSQDNTHLFEMAAQGGLQAIGSFGGSLLSLLLFCSILSHGRREGTFHTSSLSPGGGNRVLLGAYLGNLVLVLGYCLMLSVALVLSQQLITTGVSPDVYYAPWLICCKMLMLGAIGLCLSLFMRPLPAALITYFAGDQTAWWAWPPPLSFVLPSYDRFLIVNDLWLGRTFQPIEIFLRSLYALDIIILVLVLARWRLQSLVRTP